ncbi:MAG TPA: hypothetical protein VNK23_07305 [Candidatus Dormibacteraeota bacterium]|nr:hypothetical protein [Candidatus Dormibacteraeota bacterium]
MGKVNLIHKILDERNIEIALAVWKELNEARPHYQQRFWARIEKHLRRKITHGWKIDPKEASMSASWYHLDLTPPSTGDLYSCIRIQQTTENEGWRLQWSVGLSTASHKKPKPPLRGLAAVRLENLRQILRKHNFQPSRVLRKWCD